MKKIMFNDKYGLTEAVLEGRKTMTRRIVPGKLVKAIEGGMPGYAVMESKYEPGEVVAVAQSLRDMGYDPRDTRHKSGAIWGLDHTPAWTNKMFVSASECIHYIRITNVRVERLQDISDGDCVWEGVVGFTCNLYEYRGICYSFPGDKNKMGTYLTPREAFASLIDKVSGKGTWDSNPWVFVYEFELVK